MFCVCFMFKLCFKTMVNFWNGLLAVWLSTPDLAAFCWLFFFDRMGTHICWPILGHSWIKCQFWSCLHCSTEQPLNNRKPENHFDVSNDTLHQKSVRPLPPAYTFWRVDPKSWEVTMSSILLQWEKLSKNLRPGWKEFGKGQMTNVGWRWCFCRGGGGVFFWWQSEEFQHFCFQSLFRDPKATCANMNWVCVNMFPHVLSSLATITCFFQRCMMICCCSLLKCQQRASQKCRK